MNHTEIILAGFGGQGILFAGKMVAYFGLLDGRQVSWLPSYGPEMRGGTANCSVCLSDRPIGSPLIVEPDTLIVMNAPSYHKFIDAVKPGGRVFIDSALISDTCDRTDVDVHYIPATRLALDNSLEGMANIIMVGKLLRETAIADMETVDATIAKCVPPAKAHLIEANRRAIDIGRAYES